MEKKRKLPARAAARVEHAAKRRQVTPQERSATPATPQPVEEPPPPPAPPSLPKSIQAGQPLPTVEEPQSENLPVKDYQSVSESGVLAESLSRSRQKWTSEGLFEKYWTKPHKRKGVVTEDPKNPPKEAMSKIGTVTITIEPHVIEATMYAVKEPKAKTQQQSQPSTGHKQQQSQLHTRPIIQYGPPNGSMPPPPTPTPTPTPTPGPAAASPTISVPGAASNSAAPGPVRASPQPSPAADQPSQPQQNISPKPPIPTVPASSKPTNSPASQAAPLNPQGSIQVSPQISAAAPRVLASPTQSPLQAHGPSQTGPSSYEPRPPPPAIAQSAAGPPIRASVNTPIKPAVAARPVAPATNPNGPRPLASPASGPPRAAASPATATVPGGPVSAPAPAAKPAANDPVIALLAQKASGDPELRDLMKRVAVGQAKDGELAHFQKIIDQLNAEYKRKGGQQGPSADRLVVDGRTVKYFAEEVRTILDIVLTSNPQQRSTELRPPPRSDPLVVLLVKKALEDPRTKDMIRRIADGRPGYNDAPELKEILDRLHKDMKAIPPRPSPQQAPAPTPAPTPAPAPAPAPTPSPTPTKQSIANGVPNGHVKGAASQNGPNPQALRSKGPPPTPKLDISAVVFDFGSGDRYLFPKYSILEYLPTNSGQQVVASFLIVRKGSMSEYGGDPSLDYYQPITIRLSTSTGRHLENLARVVAPQDEVRRYMNDVMDNMTRAEYVLLAMQLPRGVKDGESEGNDEPAKAGTPAPTLKADVDGDRGHGASQAPVLWTTAAKKTSPERGIQAEPLDPEEESQRRYQKLIKSAAARDTEGI